MKVFLSIIYILVLILASAVFADAQKNMDQVTKVRKVKPRTTIILPDSLAVHSDKLYLYPETEWLRKIQVWQFGEYKVVASKMGNIKRSATSNLLNTKTEKIINRKFSMVISNRTLDTARIFAKDSTFIRARQEAKLFKQTIGGVELLLESRYFQAIITLNQDTNQSWTLALNSAWGTQVEANYEAFLTCGERNITLKCASSNEYCSFRDLYQFWKSRDAKGIKFSEHGQLLCALQFSPILPSGQIVWMEKRLDAKMKLILISAIAAFLQNRKQYNVFAP